MKGFVIGTLGLVAVGAFLRSRNGAAAVKSGSGWFVSGLSRLMSADVAGVPYRAAGGSTGQSARTEAAKHVPASAYPSGFGRS